VGSRIAPTPPLPLQAASLQSPGVCAATGVFAAVNATPQAPLTHVRALHSSSLPAQSEGALHPTHAPAPSQIKAGPHTTPGGLPGCDGIPPRHTSSVHGLASSTGTHAAPPVPALALLVAVPLPPAPPPPVPAALLAEALLLAAPPVPLPVDALLLAAPPVPLPVDALLPPAPPLPLLVAVLVPLLLPPPAAPVAVVPPDPGVQPLTNASAARTSADLHRFERSLLVLPVNAAARAR
jgi:hypothetical protein